MFVLHEFRLGIVKEHIVGCKQTNKQASKQANKQTDIESSHIHIPLESGDLEAIPAGLRLRYYRTLKQIESDNMELVERDGIVCRVYWGVTGSGKSHKAWADATREARRLGVEGDGDVSSWSDGKVRTKLVYVKQSGTKWWDRYDDRQKVVIIDDFRGGIAIENMLTWLDKYPCMVEKKGSQGPLHAVSFYITSNLSPTEWYPTNPACDTASLLRRLEVTHFATPFEEPQATPGSTTLSTTPA